MRNRRWLLIAALLLVLTCSVGIWWWSRPARMAPPFPEKLPDAEVRLAVEEARRQVLDEPESAEAWGRLAMVLLAHLFDREAAVCFAEAARLDPAEPQWPYGRALIALKREPENALPWLHQAAQAEGASLSYWLAVRYQLGEALLERGRLDEADKVFVQVDDRNPGDVRAALGRGQVAVLREEHAVAARFLTAILDDPCARKAATAQLAALARSRGDQQAAAALEKQLATLKNDLPWPDPLLDGLLDFEVGRRGLERKLGRLEKDRRFDEAAQLYLKQIEEHPTMPAYVGAGVNFIRLRDYDRAMPLLRKGVAMAPESDFARYTLALALFARAEREWQTTPGAAELKEWFREAVVHAQRATELRVDHAKAYLVWGLALKYLGEPRSAVAPLKKGIACHPADFELQYGLGEVLLELGRSQEAESHFENARRINAQDSRPGAALERLHKKVNK